MSKWSKENPTKALEYKLKRKLEGKHNRGNRKAQDKRRREKNPLKSRAMMRVCYAIKKGKLIKPKNCSICNIKGYIMGHHEDYNKPLEVIWVCWKCHEEIHAKKVA
jgi:Skp family chaperone for outer membrane proteins